MFLPVSSNVAPSFKLIFAKDESSEIGAMIVETWDDTYSNFCEFPSTRISALLKNLFLLLTSALTVPAKIFKSPVNWLLFPVRVNKESESPVFTTVPEPSIFASIKVSETLSDTILVVAPFAVFIEPPLTFTSVSVAVPLLSRTTLSNETKSSPVVFVIVKLPLSTVKFWFFIIFSVIF